MMDRRWQVISLPICTGGVRVVGSGYAKANGEYCPDGTENGQPCWTKRGGVRLKDSIYYHLLPDEWHLTSGGTFEDDPVFVRNVWVNLPPINTWAPGFSPLVGPAGLMVLRDLGPLQYAKFSEDEDLSVGLIAKRRKLATDLVFVGADFDYFRAIERDPVRRCEEIFIRRQWRCDGKWKTVWTGSFSTGSGSWDFDLCQFTVRPDVVDEYTCIMRAMNKKVNVLQVAPVDATALILPSMEFAVCVPGLPNECPDVTDIDGVTPINEYTVGHAQTVPYDCGGDSGSFTLTTFWREKQRTFCVGGSPVPPVGAGWVLLQDDCGVDGTAIYVRNSTIAWTFGDATIVESSSPIAVAPDDSCAWMYLGTVDVEQDVNPFCPNWYVHAFICLTSGDAIEYSRARTLQGIANYMLEKSGCEQTEMVSDLFEWDPPGDAPGYAAGVNYVTGGTNQYNAIVALQNSDALNPAATNPATIGELTLRELFTLLATGPRMFWAIDTLGRLRIEHWTFWTTPVGLDIAGFSAADKSEPMSYTHLKSEVPRYERPKWAHAQGSDFVGSDIEYSGPCVSTDGENDVKEYNAGPFTTDIAFVSTDPGAISKTGFTLLATTFDGAVYNTILDYGALSGDFIINAPLSWANLERDFWTWDRFLPSGTMNRQAIDFDGFVPTIEQKNVFAKLCCAYVEYDSSLRVQTSLGNKLGGITAFVKRAEYDEATEGLTLTLRYAY